MEPSEYELGPRDDRKALSVGCPRNEVRYRHPTAQTSADPESLRARVRRRTRPPCDLLGLRSQVTLFPPWDKDLRRLYPRFVKMFQELLDLG